MFATLIAILVAFISTKTKIPTRLYIDKILTAAFYIALTVFNYTLCLASEMEYITSHAIEAYIYCFAAVN